MAKVVLRLGDDVSTDAIYPGRFMATVLPTETPQYCFADLTEFNKKLKDGAVAAGQRRGGRPQLRHRLVARAGGLLPQGLGPDGGGQQLLAHLPAERRQPGPAAGDLPGHRGLRGRRAGVQGRRRW